MIKMYHIQNQMALKAGGEFCNEYDRPRVNIINT